MPLRAHRLLDLVAELDEGTPLGNAHGLQIVHAARTDTAFHDIARHAEILGPVGDERDARQMRSRRASADVEPVGVGAKAYGVLVDPGNSASDLAGHDAQVATCLLDLDEVDGDEILVCVDK